MKNGIVAAALAIAAVTSSAALAAPKGDGGGARSGGQDRDFTCLIPYPGPMGFKPSPCWRVSSGDSLG